MSVEETGVWTETYPKEPCPFCGKTVAIRISEILIVDKKYWKVRIFDDSGCPLSAMFERGLRMGSAGKCVPFLKKDWHEIVETVSTMPVCPECGRSPVCRYSTNLDRWIILCEKGHLRTDEAFVLSAMRNWNKKVGQYVCDNQNQRLGQCLMEFWHQGDTSDENLPEFMRQSWRIKHADWERK